MILLGYVAENTYICSMNRIKELAKPCPFCGSDKLTFSSYQQHGHGDTGYTGGRIICLDCDATRGLYDYGLPNNATIENAINAWNTRDGNNDVAVRYVDPPRQLTEEEEMYLELAKKYSNMSVMEFLTQFNNKT